MNIAMQRLARPVVRAGHGNRLRIAARLLLPVALLEVALWAPLPVGILFGVAALGYMAYQLWPATGTAQGMGLGVRGLLQNSWMVGVTLLGSALVLATAYFSGTLHRLWGLQNPLWAVVGYVVWALVQQFMLQCFCLRMLLAVVSRVSALLLSGVIFAGAPAQPQPHPAHLLCRRRLYGALRPQEKSLRHRAHPRRAGPDSGRQRPGCLVPRHERRP